jgi:hypothetical protein
MVAIFFTLCFKNALSVSELSDAKLKPCFCEENWVIVILFDKGII